MQKKINARSVDAHCVLVSLSLQKSRGADSWSAKHGNAAQLVGSRMGSLFSSTTKSSARSSSWSYCRLPGGKRGFLLRRTASWAIEQVVHTTSHDLLVCSTTRRGGKDGQWSGQTIEGARSWSRREKASVRCLEEVHRSVNRRWTLDEKPNCPPSHPSRPLPWKFHPTDNDGTSRPRLQLHAWRQISYVDKNAYPYIHARGNDIDSCGLILTPNWHRGITSFMIQCKFSLDLLTTTRQELLNL